MAHKKNFVLNLFCKVRREMLIKLFWKTSIKKYPYFISLCSASAICILVNLTGCTKPWEADMDRYNNLQRDMKKLYDVPPPPPKMNLTEIIDTALQMNLATRVKLYEYAVQHELATGEALKMLPSVIVNGDVSWRNRNTGSASESLVPGVPPAPPSISSEQNVHRYDITAIFNLLDFGLSFLRSRQEANKARTMQLEYARLQQNLIVDVTKQYWRAVAAKRALDGSKHIRKTLDRQILALERLMEHRIIPEIFGLRNENLLVNLKIQFQHYEKEYHEAMTTLKQLMGLTTSCDFEIVYEESAPIDIGCYSICELEEIALFNRPELKIGDLEEKIARDDVYAAILQMLPSGEGFVGDFYDGNRFLIFNHWLIMGARATWNLLAFPRRWYEKSAGEFREKLARQNRLNLSIGVITQVNLAYLDYLDNLDTFRLAEQLRNVNTRMLFAARKEVRYGRILEADLVKFEADALLSEVDYLRAYGELQNSLEQLNNALGLPFFFNKENEEIEEIIEIETPVDFGSKEVIWQPLPKIETFIESIWEEGSTMPRSTPYNSLGKPFYDDVLPPLGSDYFTEKAMPNKHLDLENALFDGTIIYAFTGELSPEENIYAMNTIMDEAIVQTFETIELPTEEIVLEITNPEMKDEESPQEDREVYSALIDYLYLSLLTYENLEELETAVMVEQESTLKEVDTQGLLVDYLFLSLLTYEALDNVEEAYVLERQLPLDDEITEIEIKLELELEEAFEDETILNFMLLQEEEIDEIKD